MKRHGGYICSKSSFKSSLFFQMYMKGDNLIVIIDFPQKF